MWSFNVQKRKDFFTIINFSTIRIQVLQNFYDKLLDMFQNDVHLLNKNTKKILREVKEMYLKMCTKRYI